jgi:hypothetical protein
MLRKGNRDCVVNVILFIGAFNGSQLIEQKKTQVI